MRHRCSAFSRALRALDPALVVPVIVMRSRGSVYKPVTEWGCGPGQ